MNSEEMQFIADELFIGNKLAAGEVQTSDGSRIDLRNITSPIIVFCSKADNITPPPQALDWILDLYESVDDIRAHGQTIVYAVHGSIGHLGIFVSGSVAKKEHGEFASNIDLIDVLPPGLYEAVMTPKDPNDPDSDLVGGDYLVRFEARSLDDIRALGGNSKEDDAKFAAVARVSEINLGLYRMFLQPWVRSWAYDGLADWMRRAHPLRLQYEMFTHANPFIRPLLSSLEVVRPKRREALGRNPLWDMQARYGEVGRDVPRCLSRHARRYGRGDVSHHLRIASASSARRPRRPMMQSLRRGPGKSASHLAFVATRIDELKSAITEGGPREAAAPRPSLHPHARRRRRRTQLQSASADARGSRQRTLPSGIQETPA